MNFPFARCLCVAALLASSALPHFAHAATCSGTPVEARGEQSRYQWIAKMKAKASWRARVRATPGLGPSYANWARAEQAEERCLTGPAGSVCFMTGIPCKL